MTATPDADTVILRWSDDGTPRTVREGDEQAGVIAFIKCVSEGLTRGDVIEGEAEQYVARALLEDDAVILTLLPSTGDTMIGKAGRVISGQNLAALQAIHDAIGGVINSEVTRRQQKPDDTDDEENVPEAGSADDASKAFEYVITKSSPDQQYTFGPLYAPDRKDAHGEYTDAETLQKAVHAYVQECVDTGNNELNVQHNVDGVQKAGKWVEVCSWPYDSVVKIKVPGESERSVTLPAGTIFMGIQWNDSIWKDVKAGNIAGLSLGGKAMRVVTDGDMAPMGDKTAAGQKPHKFQPSEDNVEECATCGMSESGGMHY